jgi:CobQ-like glutamine amidotransferase family enzyme
LPKNPALADHLILEALKRRQIGVALAPLNDTLERAAAKIAELRPR